MLLMDLVCASADPIKKIVATIAAIQRVRTIKLGSPRTGFEIRDREISGPWLMELTNRMEMGSCNMGYGLLRLIARNLLFQSFRILATHGPGKDGVHCSFMGYK